MLLRIEIKVARSKQSRQDLKKVPIPVWSSNRRKPRRGGKVRRGQAAKRRQGPTVIPGPGSPCGCAQCGGTAWSVTPAHVGGAGAPLCWAGCGAQAQAPRRAGPPGEELAPKSSHLSPGESVWSYLWDPARGVGGWRFLFSVECHLIWKIELINLENYLQVMAFMCSLFSYCSGFPFHLN